MVGSQFRYELAVRHAGRRGQATRQKLLDCLGKMLGTSPYRDVRVIDVARKAGTSPATFYQYFPDVEAAVLEIAEGAVRESAALSELVAGRSWSGKAGRQTAEELVDGFLAFWRRAGYDREELASLDALVAATEFACLVAGRTCERPGASPPHLSEL